MNSNARLDLVSDIDEMLAVFVKMLLFEKILGKIFDA